MYSTIVLEAQGLAMACKTSELDSIMRHDSCLDVSCGFPVHGHNLAVGPSGPWPSTSHAWTSGHRIPRWECACSAKWWMASCLDDDDDHDYDDVDSHRLCLSRPAGGVGLRSTPQVNPPSILFHYQLVVVHSMGTIDH